MTRYELLDRIGVGGMAEIFRGKAVAAGGFEKPVAIKRILPHLSQDRRFVELLIAEAKVLSLLKHRNIVQIFDVGLGDDGQYFLVMEYVDGKDIGAVQRALESKRRRLPFDLALHIGAEICEALEHAHVSRGPDGKPMALVHRDVSPSNVLLSRAGEVKLTDFGIAKRAESDATQGGAVRGKFAYISPEQARNEPLDPRSDVFSVGILMWELCCNRRLFSGLDDLAALRAVRDPGTVKRPSEIDPRLPPELDQLLMTALARDKKQRFSGCGVLGQKLRSLRYSLEVTVGDPATELAKIIDSAEEVERQSKQHIAAVPPSGRNDFDGAEATVIRIHTADAFSARDEGKSISQARQVIDRFEEEETRLASLSGDQLRMLRKGSRDSVEMTAEKPRMDRAAGKRPKRDSGIDDDEMTRAREPLDLGRKTGGPKRELYDSPFETPAGATLPGGDESSGPSYTPSDPSYASLDTPPHQRLTPTDDTRLHRRTPMPQRTVRPQGRAPTAPPPVPERTRAPSQGVATQPPMGQPLQMAQPSIPPPLQPNLRTPIPQQPMLPMGPAMPHVATPMPQQPGMPTPQPGQPLPPHLAQPPFMPSQNAGAYANQGWGPPVASQMPMREATPTAQDPYDQRAMYPNRPSMPQVAGFQPRSTVKTRGGLKPWVLVVGALIMAALAFAITRAFIG